MSSIDAARNLTCSYIEEIPDGTLVSNDHRDLMAAIRDMKVGKILAFHDAMRKGEASREVGRNVISVLKSDVLVCDALIVTDFDDPTDVSATLSLVSSVVTSSPEPSNQSDYIAVLTDNEASMEVAYSKMIKELQGMLREAQRAFQTALKRRRTSAQTPSNDHLFIA